MCIVPRSYRTVPEKASRDIVYRKVKIGLDVTRLMRTDCIIVTAHQGHSYGTDHHPRIDLSTALLI